MVNLIKASNINVSRQGSKILENVSVVVGDHDFLTVIGPNGAGKSMLLKCLMGFYAPDSRKNTENEWFASWICSATLCA